MSPTANFAPATLTVTAPLTASAFVTLRSELPGLTPTTSPRFRLRVVAALLPKVAALAMSWAPANDALTPKEVPLSSETLPPPVPSVLRTRLPPVTVLLPR